MPLLSSEPKPRTKGHHFRGEGAGEGDSPCGGADLPGNPQPQRPTARADIKVEMFSLCSIRGPAGPAEGAD